MSMEQLFRFLFIVFVLGAVSWIIAGVLKARDAAQNKTQPVRVKPAKVIDMQQVSSNEVVFGEIWVMFEMEDGERIRLNAKANNTWMVGDKGTLTWQGKRILKFERNKM